MANEEPIRYYKPKSDFKFDITDIQNFVYDMSRCIKCKGCTWVDHTYMPGPKFMTRCPSAAKYEFDAYGAYGKMRIGHAMAEGLLDWNEKALEVMYACTLCGACDVGCKRNLDLEIELSLESLRVKAVKDGVGPMPAHKKIAANIAQTSQHVRRSPRETNRLDSQRDHPGEKGRCALLRGLHRFLCEQRNRSVHGEDPEGSRNGIHAHAGRMVLRKHPVFRGPV